ncbi:hypothetical protein ACFC0M_36240 [Streptomyces sp. NPDC056149]|uniref:hypothetical protein n=1 Tax=Streptomyces sp. NPDC056149 TaxID=3345728 RepID=UPI0035DD5F97
MNSTCRSSPESSRRAFTLCPISCRSLARWGITPGIGPLLVIDWAPSEAEDDRVLYVFDGGQLSPGELAGIKLASDELLAAEFRLVDNLNEAVDPQTRAPRQGSDHGQNRGAPHVSGARSAATGIGTV